MFKLTVGHPCTVRVLVRLLAIAAVATLFSSTPSVTASPRPSPNALVLGTHAPIFIGGTADLTAANGVTGGNGSAVNPYVISGWSIETQGVLYPPGYPQGAIQINDTSAYVLLRDLAIVSSVPSGSGNLTIGISLSNASHVSVENVSLVNLVQGIDVAGGVDIRVSNCTMSPVGWFAGNLEYGVDIYGSVGVTVSDVSIGPFSEHPISLISASDVRIQRAVVARTYSDLTIYHSDNVTLTDSSLDLGDQGISMIDSTDILISGNTIRSLFPVLVQEGARVTFVRNTIPDIVQAPFYLWATRAFVAYHNNFLNGTAGPMQGNDTTEIILDDGYPLGGNYWGDYQGTDNCWGPDQGNCTNRDGIRDAPYRIDLIFPSITRTFLGVFTDHYPFIRPWPLPNVSPHVVFRVSAGSGDTTTAFIFDGANSTDSRDPLSALQFRFLIASNGFPSLQTGWGNRTSISKSFPTSGDFAVTLEVRNTAGLISQATVIIHVEAAVPPAPNLALIAGIVVFLAAGILYLRHRLLNPRKSAKARDEEGGISGEASAEQPPKARPPGE